MNPEKLYVTRPFLPPLEEFQPYLEAIWANGQVTNGGPFHHQLEAALADYLEVPHLSLFANGTLALVTALKALNLTGEVITTPYSFVATAHALVWNGLRPVFVDIDPVSLNLDPAAIKAAITPRTRAILPVHVYGRPCATEAIQAIADAHGLKVIYDAAHAFGVAVEGTPLLARGDLSVLSFHGTKVFHTFEGGAIACGSAEMKAHIDLLKNFGFAGETRVLEVGINGKMNEPQAAFGLLHLKYMDTILARRGEVDAAYRSGLADLPGLALLPLPEVRRYNHSYFPLLVNTPAGGGRDGLYQHLRDHGVYARRYFYPLISDFAPYQAMEGMTGATPVARRIADQVLCLPIYPGLECHEQDRIIGLVRAWIEGG